MIIPSTPRRVKSLLHSVAYIAFNILFLVSYHFDDYAIIGLRITSAVLAFNILPVYTWYNFFFRHNQHTLTQIHY